MVSILQQQLQFVLLLLLSLYKIMPHGLLIIISLNNRLILFNEMYKEIKLHKKLGFEISTIIIHIVVIIIIIIIIIRKNHATWFGG